MSTTHGIQSKCDRQFGTDVNTDEWMHGHRVKLYNPHSEDIAKYEYTNII